MPIRFWTGALGAASLTLALSACARPVMSVCPAPLQSALEVNLHFGRDKPAGGEVSDAEWASFLAEAVTPRFPAGLTVIDAQGQYRDPSGRIGGERTKLVVIVVFDAPAHREKVKAIVESYRTRFSQYGVFRVEKPVCAGE